MIIINIFTQFQSNQNKEKLKFEGKNREEERKCTNRPLSHNFMVNC